MQTKQTVFSPFLGVYFDNYATGIKRLATVMPLILIICLWFFGHVSPASAEALCAAGTFSDSGMEPCTPCPPGQFTADSGSTSCSPCPTGKFSADSGSASCTLCPVDTSAGTIGSEACTPCPSGQSAQIGSAECSISTQSCPPGKYSATGKEPCTACLAGSYTSVSGSAACNACPPDTYASLAGQAACTPCPTGTTALAGSTACTPFPQSCPPGKYSDTGKEPCIDCSAGAFASDAGSTACTVCPAGKFASTTGSAACNLCPANTFASLAGQAACTPCPSGKTAPIGSTACTLLSSDTDGDGVPNNQDDCPNSDLSPTVVIAGCNTGVTKAVFPNGCTISDRVASCTNSASNHGQFVSCVARLTNDLNKAGTITGQQKGAIQSCAAQANIP